MLRGFLRSARTFFFISRAVCFLPRFWSAWGDTEGRVEPARAAAGCSARARAHLGQVAAVVGAHGGQSLLFLQVVLRPPLGVLFFPPRLLLLRAQPTPSQDLGTGVGRLLGPGTFRKALVPVGPTLSRGFCGAGGTWLTAWAPRPVSRGLSERSGSRGS